MPNYWINTVSRSHVQRGIEGGFTQANHGKSSTLKRLARGDLVAFYSPRTDYPDGEPLQRFTAIGRVLDDAPYQVEMTPDFHPWRRQMEFLPAEEAPIRDVSLRPGLHSRSATLGHALPSRPLPDRRGRLPAHRPRHEGCDLVQEGQPLPSVVDTQRRAAPPGNIPAPKLSKLDWGAPGIRTEYVTVPRRGRLLRFSQSSPSPAANFSCCRAPESPYLYPYLYGWADRCQGIQRNGNGEPRLSSFTSRGHHATDTPCPRLRLPALPAAG